MEIRKNISLVVGLAIPVVMVILVALSIYVPRMYAPKPQFDFVYVSGGDYYGYGYNIYVENGKIKRVETPPPVMMDGSAPLLPKPVDSVPPKIFVYDVTQNESREVSLEEAQNFNLDSNVKSADGFEVVYGSNYSGPFYSGDYNTKYIKGHNVSTKLNINSSAPYYDFRFLGWIKK